MTISERIKAQRKQLGLNPRTVAELIGINESWYRDLESYDDELEEVLSIKGAILLAQILKTSVQELVFGEILDANPVQMATLPEVIQQHLEHTGKTLEIFEDQVGWYLADLSNVTRDYTLEFLRNLAKELAIPYHSLVPINTV